MRTKNLAVDESTRRHDCCCPSERKPLRPDSCAIHASFVETVCGLKVPPAFPWRRRHAWHCLPALLRVLSWVPWALVPHASGQGSLPCPAVLCVATTAFVLPGRSAFGSLPVPWVDALCFVSLPACARVGSSAGRVGHQTPGCWLRRSPLLRLIAPKETGGSPEFPDYPFAHMPRSQTPVVSRPLALARTGLLPSGALHTVGFGSGCPDLSCCPPLYIFRSSMTRPVFSPYLCFGHRLSAIALRFGCRPGG